MTQYAVCTGTTVQYGTNSVFNLPSGWKPSNCYPIAAYYYIESKNRRYSCIGDVWFDLDTQNSGRLNGQSQSDAVGVPFYVVLAKIIIY